MVFRNLRGYFTNKWVLVNPFLVWRTVKGFWRALFGRNTLRNIEIFPSMKCNLKCRMCSIEKFNDEPGEPLMQKDYERLANEAAALGCASVTILGGEPLLVQDLKEIIRIFHRRHYYVHMVSNATTITRKKLEELKNVGLNGICISLDSLDEKENDAIRGLPGHYMKAMDSINIAKELGLVVSLAPVFFPGRLEEGIKVVEFCQSHGIGASGSQVSPVGGWEGQQILSKKENDRIRQLIKKFPRMTMDWGMSYFLKCRCPAGKEKVAISTNGNVFGCSINPISFGNIKHEELRKILKRMQSFSKLNIDSSVCLAGEDADYVERFLRPLEKFDHYPVAWTEHPALTQEREPNLHR